MAKIVAVHGVGQQFKGDAIIHSAWWPALRSGLHLAGRDLSDEGEMVCPFYGHLFRKPGELSEGGIYNANDVGDEEFALLELLWHAASKTEPNKVPSKNAYLAGQSLARTPQWVQRGLNALSKSKFFVNVSQSLLIGDLKQMLRYFDDTDLREKVLKTVLDCITPDTKVVIGHSMGSVVAYEALCRKPENAISFISIGSPLGIRNLVFDKLSPPPNAMGIGKWPGKVTYWTNIADKGDIVAIQKQLAPLFGDRVKDVLIYNGSDAHHGERYLTTQEAGEAIKQGVWPENS